MRHRTVSEANRKRSCALLEVLGYDPGVVRDTRGDGLLDWDGDTLELEIAEFDENGKVKRDDYGEAVTHTDRVKPTPEQMATYRATLNGEDT
jgi:hypothetical protein